MYILGISVLKVTMPLRSIILLHWRNTRFISVDVCQLGIDTNIILGVFITFVEA